MDQLYTALKKEFRKLHRKGDVSHKMLSFNNLSAFITLIPIIIYFFQTAERREIHRRLKELLKNNGLFPEKYNELFNVSIKYLLKNGALITNYDVETSSELLLLSEKGYNETFKLIKNPIAKERTILHDRIRCAILKEQLNN